MSQPDPEPTTFADLGLRPELLRCARRAGLRGADADPARGDPAAARPDATCSARRPPARARPRRSRCRCCSGCAEDGRGERRRWRSCSCRPASWRCRWRRRSTATAASWAPACCRSTAGSRSAGSCGRCDRGVDVVVATPGRALDHIGRGTLRLDGVRDRRAGRGRRDARHGLRRGHRGDPGEPRRATGRPCCSRRRCRRASTAIAAAHLRDPVRIEIGPSRTRRARRRWSGRAPTSCRARTSRPRSAGCWTWRRRTAALVFCRTRDEVDELTETLNGRGYRAEALHGGMGQEQRDRVMGRLRGGTADLLVATDVAARGLDIEQLTHVVNYDVPSAPDGVRAPHRPRRPGRARGRGHHAGRAARAPDAQDDRAGDRAAHRGGEAADGRRPAGPAAGADPGRAARRACSSRRPGRSASSSRRWPASSTSMEVALAAVKLAHEAQRWRDRRRGDPGDRRPCAERATCAGRRQRRSARAIRTGSDAGRRA